MWTFAKSILMYLKLRKHINFLLPIVKRVVRDILASDAQGRQKVLFKLRPIEGRIEKMCGRVVLFTVQGL